MIFTRDFVTRENHWQIASLVTQKSLFTVTHALFFISCMKINLDWKCRLQNVGNFVLASVYQPTTFTPSSNGSIFRVTGPLCGEFTGHRWIPLAKASDAELWCSICAWINDWVNNRNAGDLRRHRAHYDVTVIPLQLTDTISMITAPRIWFIATGGT